ARLAHALGLGSAAIELRAVDAGERSVVFALREGTRQIGTLVLPAGAPEAVLRRVQVRVAPALEQLLAAALERAALEELALPPETFKVAIDADLPPVRADAAQLQRAFANLLENAYRHSGGHPVSVPGRDVGGRILLRFVDRGPGVPEAQRERIFEPFYRSGTAATGHRGSG